MSLLKIVNLNNLKQLFHSKRFIFYSNLLLFTATVFCCKIFTQEINRYWRLQLFIGVFVLVLPMILAVREKLRFLLFAAGTFASISFLLHDIDDLLQISLRNNLIILSASGIIFLSMLLLISKAKMSDPGRKITICIYVGIISLPLLCYFSFDLERVINAYHISVLIGDVWENFWCNHDIQSAFIGLGIRLVILLGCVFIIQHPFPVLKFRCNWTALIFIVLTALFLLYELRFLYSVPEDPAFCLTNTKHGSYKKMNNPLADGSYDVKHNGVPGLYFLIVGESHEYKSSCKALLGRDTFFNSIHDDPRYFVFKKVSSLQSDAGVDLNYSGISELNVCNMMSLAPQAVNVQRLSQEPDFLDIMQILKYKQLFIHNVGAWLVFNVTMHAMFRRADFSLIADRNSYGRKYRNRGFQVDNELPGVLQKLYKNNIFDKNKSFTVIKPMGLHNGVIVIPEDFVRQHQDMSNEERGLLYYDNMLAKIISVLRSFPETRAIVYCSDHGVNVKGNKNEIVMFVYLSDELQKRRPELAGKIRNFSEEKFSNIHIDRLLLEIMDISVTEK